MFLVQGSQLLRAFKTTVIRLSSNLLPKYFIKNNHYSFIFYHPSILFPLKFKEILLLKTIFFNGVLMNVQYYKTYITVHFMCYMQEVPKYISNIFLNRSFFSFYHALFTLLFYTM